MMSLIKDLGIASGNNSTMLNPFAGKDPDKCKVVNIKISIEKGSFVFNGIQVEDYDNENYEKYLYKESPGKNNPNYTPSIKFSDKDFMLEKRIVPWFINQCYKMSLIGDMLLKNKSNIVKELNHISKTKDKKCSYLVTFTIDNKYLSEIPEMHQYLSDNVLAEKEKVSGNGVCSLCNNKGVVYGNSSPITTYTIDKSCFIAGGYDKKHGWKNFPLCDRCISGLEHGVEILDELFRFKLGGIGCYLIPYYLKNNLSSLKELINEYRINRTNNVFDVPYTINNECDLLVLNLLFYEKQSSKFMIYDYIDNVSNSHLSYVAKVISNVENNECFKELKSKNGLFNLKFDFSFLREFTKNKWIRSLQSNDYLELVSCMLNNKKFDTPYLFSMLMYTLREEWKENKCFELSILKAYMSVNLLSELGVINADYEEDVNMGDDIVTSEFARQLDEFFCSNCKTWKNNTIKAVFLLGVLTKKLMAVQFKKLNNTPFEKQLKDLMMTENDVRGLFPKVVNKLREYHTTYADLQNTIASYFAGKQHKLSREEINFYFLMGMTLCNKLAIFTNKKGEVIK